MAFLAPAASAAAAVVVAVPFAAVISDFLDEIATGKLRRLFFVDLWWRMNL